MVVPSRGRPLRLRWLLNALADQRYPGPWDVVVVHEYDRDTAARIFADHPLTAAGRLREIASPATTAARKRNLGWRAAPGRLVAFTDDDCRPEPEWLDRLIASVRDPDADVIQGHTRPDPLERDVLAAPHVRTLLIEPPGPFAQTANMLYPRAVLERVGGFDERAVSGEDVGLVQRARAAGSPVVPAWRAVVNHAVESHTLPGILRENVKWSDLAYLVKHHPEVRRDLTLRVFWDRGHLLIAVAVAGVAVTRTRRARLALAAPWLLSAAGRRGHGLRARATAVAELPGQSVRQLGELAGMAAGSVRYRTILL